MQIIHVANWCTWLAHALCKGLIWNYKKLLSTSLTFIWDPASASILFFTDIGFCSEFFKSAIFPSFGKMYSFIFLKNCLAAKVKVTEIKTQLSRFRTITPVWFHIWWWNDAQCLVLFRRGALLISRSSVKFQGHTAKKNHRFGHKLDVSDCISSLNSQMTKKWCIKFEVAEKSCPIIFQGHP